MDRTFVRTVVIFVIGLLAGLFIGRWSAPGTWEDRPDEAPPVEAVPEVPADTASEARAGERWVPRVGSAGDGSRQAPGVQVPAAQERVRELEAEVEVLRAQLESAGERPPAAPVEWPEGRPEKFTEPGFRALIEQSLAECDVPVELQRLECSEPPCVAVMRTTGEDWHEALVNNCPIWNQAYGTTVSMDDGKVDCVGAEQEGYALLSPFDHEWREELDKDESGNVGERLQERWDSIKADWDCR